MIKKGTDDSAIDSAAENGTGGGPADSATKTDTDNNAVDFVAEKAPTTVPQTQQPRKITALQTPQQRKLHETVLHPDPEALSKR